MSAVVPGLGLAYIRQWWRAVYWFGLAVLAGSVGLPTPLLRATGTTSRTASVLLVGFVAVVSVVDTYRTAVFVWQGPATTGEAGVGRCEACGRSVDGDLAFCHWCGERFGDAGRDGATADGGRPESHE